MFESTPEELRALKQWVCFDILPSLEEGKKPRKIPFIAGESGFAESTNPSTWRTFEEATKDVVDGKRQHLGFCFNHTDPYVFIDLDEDQPEIFQTFNSYSQKSVSGNGIHIIVKGKFEGEGKHPSAPAVGLFQDARFCLWTANVVENRTTINVVSNAQLQSLHDWLSPNTPTADLVDEPQTIEDEEVLTKCSKRFETFNDLYKGVAGADHSESDHKLICMLADESDCNEQVYRLFCQSALCRPHRANRNYVNLSLRKVRGKQEQHAEISVCFDDETTTVEEEPRGDNSTIESMPNGLLKRTARWLHGSAYVPLQEASICAAFGVFGTVAGRSFFTDSGMGLPLWMILVAGTGSGKNDYQNGMNRVIHAVSKHNDLGGGWTRLLLGEAASGEGIEDALARSPRANCYFPEFGDILRKMNASVPAPNHGSLKKQLLDMFGQSARNGFLKRRVKARTKDDQDEHLPIIAPCLTVGGESTKEGIYDHLSINEILNGFTQRFIFWDSESESISLESNLTPGGDMPEDLKDDLLEFFIECDRMNATDTFINVPSTPEAKKLMRDYETKLRRDNYYNPDQSKSQITNRAPVKAMKIATTFAVAANFKNPMVTVEHAIWAINFITERDMKLLSRFDAGNIGMGQVKQESVVIEMIAEAAAMSMKKKVAQGFPDVISRRKNIFPFNWLKDRCKKHPAFISDSNGAIKSFEATIGQLLRGKKIAVVDESVYGKGAGLVYEKL